jgi:putative transposase
MDTRHFKLTEDARWGLEQAALASKDVEERRHIQAVRLFGTGEALGSIVRVVQASERTIGRWVKRYQEGGLAGLARRAQPGNHRKLSREEWTAVVQVLKDSTPVTAGLSERAYWTVAEVAQVVKARYRVEYVGRSRYHALLHAAGLSFQRATKVYRHQPSAAVISDGEADAEKK